MVGRAKKQDPEGFTYIAFDMQQLCMVQIREFFPREICVRIVDSTDIAVVAGNETAFDEYLNDFISYQESIEKFTDQPALLAVEDLFEENYTAYSVSPWEEAITLRYFVERSGGSLSWNAAWKLFMPVINAVSALYAAGVGHYGISPDTLFIMQNGSMKLGGFCSPTVRMAAGGLPGCLKSGCAAEEQYNKEGKVGEYTDVYGMAATLFYALTGVLPKDARKRCKDPRLLLPASTLRSIPPHVVTALANALQVVPDNRTPTLERFRAELSAAPTATASLEETQSLRRIPSPYDDSSDRAARARRQQEKEKEDEHKSIPKFVSVILILVAVLVCVTIGVVAYLSNHNILGNMQTASATASVSTSAVTSTAQKTSSVTSVSKQSSASSAASLPDGQIEVPNLIGKNFSNLSKNSNYQVVETRKEFSDTVEEGCIISQTPKYGSGTMVKGAAISVTVSQGKALRVLPKIAGLTYSEAKSKVESAGLIPKNRTLQFSDSVSKGVVIGYGDGLTAGSQLNYQYPVTILVSAGAEESSSTDSTSGDNTTGDTTGNTDSTTDSSTTG
jgi:serine/threonine-protein kinase